MSKILAIDLGTTYFKFTLFDRDGRLCAASKIAPPVVGNASGRMELSAGDFAQSIADGIASLGKSESLNAVEAVVFATQTNSFVLLDAGNRPLTPIVLWPDRRAESFESKVKELSSGSIFSATTGVPSLSHQFMAAKLLWCQRESPDAWNRTRKICLISDYLTFLLTGKFAAEAGAAGLTGLVDIHQCRWWPEMLDRFGLVEAQMPEVVRAGADLGAIASSAAQQFGLPKSCRFIVGCLDQYAGAIGVGNVEPGMVSETTGTVLATVACANDFSTGLGPQVFQGPAFRKGLYWRMIFGDVSANYLQWYRDQLPDRPEFEALEQLAASVERGAEGLRLRLDAGLTVPEAVFENLTPRHARGAMVRCIMEAVAEALNGQVSALCKGAPPQLIRCAGGAARSKLWLQIKADRLKIATAATACPEPTSLGAAVLAEASLGNSAVAEIARRWVRLQPPHAPRAD